ncbi:hypothetical protein SCMU_13910 [Sinomonas cyclohexanicum]|uniref:Uncharacterized protein n=1 Tax=Sinomonas cyclohexanicum TaxID=322009 RepID=A0ABN6FG29_SINCY|nr:hypothetical protein [Corynebacterium cyclohexanicum]BCT75549.1 hypothetical protein SCMU_13910 [Corynebacterium cyclohexanicum]
MTDHAPDEMTELYDADIDRVDLVGRAANGHRFLIAKSGGGMVPAGTVRDLIKRDIPAKERDSLPDSDFAGPDRSFPIAEPEDVAAAAHSLGRAKGDRDAIKAKIISIAHRKGASFVAQLPDTWKEGDVAKADAPTDLTEPLAVEGTPITPGDRDWEATDAATARKWIAVLTRAKHAVDLLTTREQIEAAAGDPDDFWDALDLSEACCAIDHAIGVLAVYAAGEDGEVMAADDAAVLKAAAAIDPDVLATIEGLAPVVKTGRALPAPDGTALKDAATAVAGTLAALPHAPQPTTQVEKETPVAEQQTPETPAAEAETLTKADTLTAVYDAAGHLIGVVAPDSITPVEPGPTAEDTAEDTDEDEPVEDAAADAPADGDETERTIPGTQTVQSPVEKGTGPVVTETATTTDIAAVLKELLTPLAEQIAKSADLAETVQALQERVEKFGALPDDRRSPLLNGATGTPGLAERDPATDPHADLRKAAAEARTQSDVIKTHKDLALAQLKDALTGGGTAHFNNVADRF